VENPALVSFLSAVCLMENNGTHEDEKERMKRRRNRAVGRGARRCFRCPSVLLAHRRSAARRVQNVR